MDISIIIVSYNVREFLRGALTSAERSLAASGLDGEIIVVDNNSSDTSVELVRTEFPHVQLFALEENIGFGRANNVGMRAARGAHLLLLNPDTILGEETLATMVRFMREHPEAGLAGCKLLNGDGSFQLPCRRGFPTPWASFTKLFGLASLFPKSRLFAQYNLTYLPIDEVAEVDALSGAFMLLTRGAYERVQGFDEDYFMYGEDLDLCFRIKKAGFKVFYVPSTATVHFKGESTRRSALNEVRVFYEAMHIFVKKNYGSSILFTAMLRLGIFLRTLLALLKRHRGAFVTMAIDFLVGVCAVALTSRLLLGEYFGLPEHNYPAALIIPAIVMVAVLALTGSYTVANRRSYAKVILAAPAALIVLSSLTYFFKEFASSRSLVLSVMSFMLATLIAIRFVWRIVDRLRYGGDRSARPTLRRTLIVGTTTEAMRIASLLKRYEFMRRYQVVGFIDRSLAKAGTEPVAGIPVIGDINMLGKVTRDNKITEVIFANDALPYSEMLVAMQRTSDENPSSLVNFNVVPTASDVVLGKQKIEVLTAAGDQVALIPVQYNIQRISHRIGKRALDLAIAAFLAPGVWLLAKLAPNSDRETMMGHIRSVIAGKLSFVGVAGSTRGERLSKAGVTSLAAITLDPRSARPEDVEQLDLYYARNHTLGMDMEILLRSIFSRGAANN